MKIDKFTVKELFKFCSTHNLTPNEVYALYYIVNKEASIYLNVNIDAYKMSLRVKGWLDSNSELAKKSHISLFKDDSISAENIEKYKVLWPAIMLPSGKNARSSSIELEGRFKWFFDNFDYSWDIIYKATLEYVKYYEERGYNFMRTSAFFIFKESTPKLRTSTLAEWCDKVTTGDVVHESFDIDL